MMTSYLIHSLEHNQALDTCFKLKKSYIFKTKWNSLHQEKLPKNTESQ